MITLFYDWKTFCKLYVFISIYVILNNFILLIPSLKKNKSFFQTPLTFRYSYYCIVIKLITIICSQDNTNSVFLKKKKMKIKSCTINRIVGRIFTLEILLKTYKLCIHQLLYECVKQLYSKMYCMHFLFSQ